jgi:hypothetical protein
LIVNSTISVTFIHKVRRCWYNAPTSRREVDIHSRTRDACRGESASLADNLCVHSARRCN